MLKNYDNFIAVIKHIIKIKEDFLSLQAWARAQNMILAAMGQRYVGPSPRNLGPGPIPGEQEKISYE
jgi:hypothetical protein